MALDLDIFKTIRETVDWLIEKYKSTDDHIIKNQLGQIADQISKLSINKLAYLALLKQELNNDSEYANLDLLQSALRTAENDTKKLKNILTEFKLDSVDISFSLKYNLEKLTQIKLLKVSQLKEILAQKFVTSKEKEQIIFELETFEQKWIDLGKEIDIAIK